MLAYYSWRLDKGLMQIQQRQKKALPMAQRKP
jgi:hypothetical protein